MSRGSNYGSIRSLYNNSWVKPACNSEVMDKFSDIAIKSVVCTQDKETNRLTVGNIITYNNGSDPAVWGPGLWLAIHLGSLNYPVEASGVTIDRMKGFIFGLPAIMACKDCSDHALFYIENYLDKSKELERVCSGRDNLFKFFVDFHNYVNKRKNKPTMSYSEALRLYSSQINVKF